MKLFFFWSVEREIWNRYTESHTLPSLTDGLSEFLSLFFFFSFLSLYLFYILQLYILLQLAVHSYPFVKIKLKKKKTIYFLAYWKYFYQFYFFNNKIEFLFKNIYKNYCIFVIIVFLSLKNMVKILFSFLSLMSVILWLKLFESREFISTRLFIFLQYFKHPKSKNMVACTFWQTCHTIFMYSWFLKFIYLW